MIEINIYRNNFNENKMKVEILDFENNKKTTKLFSNKISIKSEKSILIIYRNKIETINVSNDMKSLVYNITDNNCDNIKINFVWGTGNIYLINNDKISTFGRMVGNFESLF